MKDAFKIKDCFKYLVFLLVGVILLSIIRQYYFINILFLVVCLFLFLIQRRDVIIFLFIVMLPTNGFVSTENNLFGIIHSSYILSFFSFVSLLIEWISIPLKWKKIITCDSMFKILKMFLIFFFLYTVLLNVKGEMIGINEIPISLHITRLLKAMLMYGALYYILKLSFLKKWSFLLKKAYICNLVLIAIGIIFISFWYKIGIYIGTTEIEDVTKEFRRSGVWALSGDENSCAGYLAIGFAFILCSLNNNLKWLWLIFIIVGITLTGSRTAFINILLVGLLFIFLSKQYKLTKKSFYVLCFFLGMYLIGLFDFIIERFLNLQTGEDEALSVDNKFGRVGGWLFYLNYIFSDIKIVLLGTSKSIYQDLHISTGYERVAHNFYIQTLYYWGVFPLLFLVAIFVGYLKNIYYNKNKYIYVIIFLPFVITLFTVSDIGSFFSFILAIGVLLNNYKYGY